MVQSTIFGKAFSDGWFQDQEDDGHGIIYSKSFNVCSYPVGSYSTPKRVGMAAHRLGSIKKRGDPSGL
jgi:hypothetical protein